ncbi:MAG TPA: CPBP family intramembrane glutamic endopeptidase [Myxococcaceae bacterium]
MSDDLPETGAEAAARQAVAQDECHPVLPFLFPGAAQLCLGRPAEGAAVVSLGAAELATGVAVAASSGISHPAAGATLTAFQDLWVASATEWALEHQRAGRARLVPPERISDLLPAPFSPDVLRHPEVWLGLLGMVGADLLVVRLLGGPGVFDPSHVGEPPNVFGRSFDPWTGNALGLGVGGALFMHVAIAEESFFRGWLQSSLSRALGETPGWLIASVLFGATHSLNVLALPPEDRPIYLGVFVPFITVLGGYLGWVYRNLGYSLAPAVALHFWYDLAVSGVAFALDPQHNPISASIRLGF